MSRYAIARSSLPAGSKALVGDVATRSFVEVTPDQVVFSFGRLGLTVPRWAIAGAERIDYPPRIRVGWRKDRRRVLTLVAATAPVVRVRLDPPGSMRLFWFNVGVDEVVVTVEDPAGFLAELGERADTV